MPWKDTVESHPLWQSLADARTLLNGGDWPDDVELRDVLARARSVLEQVEQRKDPASVTADSLNQANNAVTNLRNALTNAKSNPAGTVAQAHQYIDQLLTHVSSWPAPDRLRLTQGDRDAAEQVRARSEEVISELKQQLEAERAQAQANLDRWQASANEQLTALATKNDELTGKLSEVTVGLPSFDGHGFRQRA